MSRLYHGYWKAKITLEDGTVTYSPPDVYEEVARFLQLASYVEVEGKRAISAVPVRADVE